jgi:membrane protease YdiL (CAAX protease family)/tetratricopeptide (TPR) repeat protein
VPATERPLPPPSDITALPPPAEAQILTVLPADPEFAATCVDTSAERLALPGPAFWAAVGWVVGTQVVQGILGAGVVIVMLALNGLGPTRANAYLLGLALALGQVAMVVIAVANLGTTRFRRALALRGISGRHCFLVILLVAPTVVLGAEIARRANQAIDAAFPASGLSFSPAIALPFAATFMETFEKVMTELSRLPWPLALLCGAVLPAIVEEIFFRGFIGRGLVARFGPGVGVLLTSLLFAVSHIVPVQVAYAMVLGLIFHFVYLTTRSLLGPILLHMLYNTCCEIQTKLAVDETFTLAGPTGEVEIEPLLVGASLATLLVLGSVLYRTRSRWVLADGSDWSPGYVTAEMCPVEGARLRRARLHGVPALLAGVVYLGFGATFAQAAFAWYVQSGALGHVRHAQSCLQDARYDEAIASCDEAIRIDPKLATAYVTRGEAYRNKEMYPQSLADFDTAIQLDPSNASAFANRGETYRLQQDDTRALADSNRAIELNPGDGWSYTVRGQVYRDRQEYSRAIADWDRSLQLAPTHSWTRAQLAWLLASCPEAQYRQGSRAVKLAKRACEETSWKDANALGALAAAHAECGTFREAIRWQEMALMHVPAEEKEFYTYLLDCYRAGEPYRAKK